MAAVIPAAPGRRPSPVKDGGGVRLGVLRAGDFIKQVTKHGSTSGCVSGTRNPTGPLHLNTSPMLPLAEAPCQWPSRRSAAGANSPLQHLRNTSPPNTFHTLIVSPPCRWRHVRVCLSQPTQQTHTAQRPRPTQ